GGATLQRDQRTRGRLQGVRALILHLPCRSLAVKLALAGTRATTSHGLKLIAARQNSLRAAAVWGSIFSSSEPSGARHATALSFARRSGANRFRPDRHPRHPELLARLRPSCRQRLGRARAYLRDSVSAAWLAGPARLDARASDESRHRPRAARCARVAQSAARLAATR